MNSIHFHELASKSHSYLQKSESEGLHKLYKFNSLSMMFLDKISRIYGKHHPDSLEVKKFVGVPNSYASIEFIRHLSNLINLSTLSENTVQHLKKWIAREQECLPFSLILDAWRSKLTEKIKPTDEEMEIFSGSLANEMKVMKPGNRFKLPAGSLNHATRLEVIKNEDGTYDIIHFNTGLGTPIVNGKFSTACKYPSIPAEKLEIPSFWKQFIEVQMQPSMDCMNDLLKNLKVEPVDIDIWLKKQLQENGSCTVHGIGAEFKHSFITGFAKLEEGWSAYKLLKSLMLSEAVKRDSASLPSSFRRMLIAKEKVRRRYLDWIGILDDPEKLKATKSAYTNALASLGCVEVLENLPPLMALSVLNKRLNHCLNFTSCKNLVRIRNILGNGVNQIGHKQIMWLESSHQVLQDMVHAKKTDLDPESLSKFLTEYALRETPLLADPLLYHLKKENFTYDRTVIVEHLVNCNPSDLEPVLELAGSFKDDAVLDACLLLITTNMEKALKLASEISDYTKKGRTLLGATLYLLSINRIADAKKTAELTPKGIEKRLAFLHISCWLATQGKMMEAITFAGKIPESQEKRAALLTIANAHLKALDSEAAKIVIALIPESPEKEEDIQNLFIY